MKMSGRQCDGIKTPRNEIELIRDRVRRLKDML